jgi:beta-glucosidase
MAAFPRRQFKSFSIVTLKKDTGMNTTSPEITRREFIAASATAAALIALGIDGSASADRAVQRRIGISDAAYASAQTRARAMTAPMTVPELISQTGSGAAAIKRLNIPAYNYYSNEALHGLCSGPQVTSFPVPLGLAAAWNPDLALQSYLIVSDECRAHDNIEHGGISYYSPATLNLHRDPRWGRCYEAPGEDPCLAASVAVQVIRGMQGDNPKYLKTTACSKHFICNNTDDDRTAVSAPVDARSFWEYYTRAYRATLTEGDVFTFMGAYSAINGIPCCADKSLMTDMLRDQWGFRGYVTSDCDAIDNIYEPHHYASSKPIASAMAIQAGTDLDCGGTLQGNLQAAMDQKLLTEDQLREAVTRLFTVRILLGLFDPPQDVPYTKISLAKMDFNAHNDVALDAGRQSLVLLKNKANFLPLDPAHVQKVAIIGPLADVCHLGGYSGSPAIMISPLKGIAERLGLPYHSAFVPGGDYTALHGTVRPQSSPLGTTQLAYISSGDWAQFKNLDFTGKTQLSAKVASAGGGGTVEVHLDKVDGPLACTFTVPSTGDWNKLVDVTAPLNGITGIHTVYLVFHGGGGFILNLERITFLPAPAANSWTGGRQVIFSGGCGVTQQKDDTDFQDAVDVAKGADVVVMVCGVNGDVDGEGHDRPDNKLTGVQSDLIQAVYAVNPNVVLVLSSNNTVSVEWEQANLPAILCAICAGQAQGTAIADVLFGDYNPGGKTPCTWYRNVDQLPPSHDYDIHNGRTYMYFDGDPLYPFGYGLSYTSFALDNLHADTHSLGMGKTAKFSVRVANTGQRMGAEVVQLYVVPPTSPVKRPIKQLAGFQRVELKPGEQKTVTFEVPYITQAFWYWDDDAKSFVCQPGTASIQIGTSSVDLPLKADLTLLPMVGALPAPDAVQTVAVKSSLA